MVCLCRFRQGSRTMRVRDLIGSSRDLVRRAMNDGAAALWGLHTASPSLSSLEHAFSILLSGVTAGRGRRLRIFVQGKPRKLNPAVREQLFLIGREAVMNALCHSEATKIEV